MSVIDIIIEYPGPWLVWMLPIIGALLMPIIGRINHKMRDIVAVLFAGLAVIAAFSMIPDLLSNHYPGDIKLLSWITFPNGSTIDIGVLVDPLSIIICNVVAFISFLIVVYSTEYMHGDSHMDRYWFFFLFFIGNMLLLVLSDNLVQTLIGWEGVGICSYGLIGYYYRDPKERWLGGPPPTKMFPPSHAGMKAFVVTAIGDVFILAAIFIIFNFAGTVNYLELIQHSQEWLGAMSKVPGLVGLTAILLLGGPIGKSAQFPLHEWLPEAMAGPTSVSALIHAATMVKAGVYLVARISPIFFLGYWSFGISEAQIFFIAIAAVGAFTTFLAASQALVTQELKKILAYSTVSQIGYMMLGLGVSGLSEGGYVIGMTSGIFHLISHALFKAALFLCAGSVIHAIENIYIFNMGGLKKLMPLTYIFMLLATLSLSGIPPFSGFWSKDAVFVASLIAAESSPISLIFLVVGAISAGLTFLYSIRMIALTFYGKPSSHIEEMEEHGHHVHESKLVMWGPYAILVGIMLIISALGLVGFFAPQYSPEIFIEESFHHMLEHMFELAHVQLPVVHVELTTKLMAMGLSALMLVVGGGLGWLFYLSGKKDPKTWVDNSLLRKTVYNFLWNRWYMNPAYYKLFVDGTLKISKLIFSTLETKVLYRISSKVADTSMQISGYLYDSLEVIGVNKIHNGIPSVVERAYHKLKKIQTGDLSFNILYILLLLILLLIGVIMWR